MTSKLCGKNALLLSLILYLNKFIPPCSSLRDVLNQTSSGLFIIDFRQSYLIWNELVNRHHFVLLVRQFHACSCVCAYICNLPLQHGTSRALKLYYLACVSFYFFITEPNAPPSDVQGHNISSTSIQVQWGNVPAADQNGVILRYTVTYKVIPDGSLLTKEVSAPTMQATLTGLSEYTAYSVTVSASTSKGVGPASEPIIVITDQDSKFSETLFIAIVKSACTEEVVMLGQ